jgi:hypothetical protein
VESVNRSQESRLRHRAQTRGYYITKSRTQPHYDNQGEYMLVDAYSNVVVLGVRYDATLNEIELFLRDAKSSEVSGSYA